MTVPIKIEQKRMLEFEKSERRSKHKQLHKWV